MARTVRVATVQLTPAEVGSPRTNFSAIRALLASHGGGSAGNGFQCDLLVLPEMIATGWYRFEHAAAIHPLCESASASASASETLVLGAELAVELNAYVVVGFAERCDPQGEAHIQTGYPVSQPFDARDPDLVSPAIEDDAQAPAATVRYYNSATLFDRSGQLIHVFRKHFLYEDDKTWAQEGPGFQYVDLPDIGRLCVGICMDLNPYDFEAPFGAFELATFCANNGVDILALPTAWLLSPPEDSEGAAQEESLKSNTTAAPSMQTIKYWALRCSPLCADINDDADAPERASSGRKRRAFLVAANRTGTERGVTFAGSSAILQFDPASSASQEGGANNAKAAPVVKLLAALGTQQQGAQVVPIQLER
ncbi:hypothetical protein OC842_002931 [Tilletia horrida]|uniref:CN hydrolase domain-containing protein n=1 Tax=Tilletia horrida TaxID=155126 RepID=A0AAN6JRR2_9BASI|nr:hypothetical protein OC842_002931 [Tilletia horrida]